MQNKYKYEGGAMSTFSMCLLLFQFGFSFKVALSVFVSTTLPRGPVDGVIECLLTPTL